MTTVAVTDRDLCKRGCAIVHSVPCEARGSYYGMPIKCVRAYCHPGDHEALFGDVDDPRRYVWPTSQDKSEGGPFGTPVVGGPTFIREIMVGHLKDPFSAERNAMPDSPEPILQFFAWGHLPAHLQEVSQDFGDLAARIVATLPRNAERTVALRKLLEGKDAAVRALIYKEG